MFHRYYIYIAMSEAVSNDQLDNMLPVAKGLSRIYIIWIDHLHMIDAFSQKEMKLNMKQRFV